ncbi:MAG: dihydroorotase [Candidatus Nealsonbacteria bacterium]
MSETIRIRKPDDFHVHLRRGQILKSVVNFTAYQFQRAVIMPNTDPPILDYQDARNYRQEIMSALNPLNSNFRPLMTIQITDNTTPEIVELAYNDGAIAGKVYPQGVTTNSKNGITDFEKSYPVFEKMQNIGMVLSLHGEAPDPSISCMDKEREFLFILIQLAKDFPKLKIVLEHVSTADGVRMVCGLPKNVVGTITIHHLLLTIDDVIGQPHNYCNPIAKTHKDICALQEAVISGNPKFFFGSDSAPHPINKKECFNASAGIFSAPVALPLLTELFERLDALENLEPFTSVFGAEFYELPLNQEHIELEKKPWGVPSQYNGIVPFWTGRTGRNISWLIKQ